MHRFQHTVFFGTGLKVLLYRGTIVSSTCLRTVPRLDSMFSKSPDCGLGGLRSQHYLLLRFVCETYCTQQNLFCLRISKFHRLCPYAALINILSRALYSAISSAGASSFRDSQRDARVMLASSAGALSQRLGCSRRPNIRTRGASPPGPPAGGNDVTIHDVSVRARRKPLLLTRYPAVSLSRLAERRPLG